MGGIAKKEGRITESRSVGSRPKNGCLPAVLVWCILASLLVLSPSLHGPWKRVLPFLGQEVVEKGC